MQYCADVKEPSKDESKVESSKPQKRRKDTWQQKSNKKKPNAANLSVQQVIRLLDIPQYSKNLKIALAIRSRNKTTYFVVKVHSCIYCYVCYSLQLQKICI